MGFLYLLNLGLKVRYVAEFYTATTAQEQRTKTNEKRANGIIFLVIFVVVRFLVLKPSVFVNIRLCGGPSFSFRLLPLPF